ncbi:sensor histidine kinase [Paenibacillus humicola]|uniref:sensor histidine kinase n=1 Tax=Paenibacillus humicola TaxID=3110540 RepID=UPI00237AC311|nr:histidine kinase [Paenibacillus humicola]
MKALLSGRVSPIIAGRLAVLLIVMFVLAGYVFGPQEDSAWKMACIYACFALLITVQLYFRFSGSRHVIDAQMAAEAAAATLLFALLIASEPQAVLLYLPVVYRCGRSMPFIRGMLALLAVFGLACLAGAVARIPLDESIMLLNPSWVLAYVPGWMLRSEEEKFARTQKLLEHIRRQQADLEEAHTELIQYALEAEEHAALRERGRMAGEIHDTVGHSLTSIIRGLDACRELLRRNPDEAEHYLLAMRSSAKEGLDDIRHALRSMQDNEQRFLKGDWDSMLERLAHRVMQTAGVKVSVDAPISVPEAKRFAVYQGIKEAITNAIRHGQATAITIRQYEVDGRIYVEIANNGFLPQRPVEAGVGLKHMGSRMRSAGGFMDYGKAEGAFRIVLGWPKTAEGEEETG